MLKIKIKDDITNTTFAILTVQTDEYGDLAIDETESKRFFIDDIDTYSDNKGEYEFSGVTLNIVNRLHV